MQDKTKHITYNNSDISLCDRLLGKSIIVENNYETIK